MDGVILTYTEAFLALYTIFVGIVVYKHIMLQRRISQIITSLLDCLEISKKSR